MPPCGAGGGAGYGGWGAGAAGAWPWGWPPWAAGPGGRTGGPYGPGAEGGTGGPYGPGAGGWWGGVGCSFDMHGTLWRAGDGAGAGAAERGPVGGQEKTGRSVGGETDRPEGGFPP
ncbi:hypothetical protein GCM10010451_01400 [Streptomyces virens]|uniref:Uncharacterized protein n=1 Tax=Streptomyces virens TaxID=285572 RepID=A0ABP6NST1_9ACTN